MWDNMKASAGLIMGARTNALEGEYQEDVDSIRLSHVFQSDDYDVDRRSFCRRSLDLTTDDKRLQALDNFRINGGIAEMLEMRHAFEGLQRVTKRLDLYLCVLGHLPAIQKEMVMACSPGRSDAVQRMRWLQFLVGCIHVGSPDVELDLDAIAAAGLEWVSDFILGSATAIRAINNVQSDRSDEDKLMDAMAATVLDAPEVEVPDDFDPTAAYDPPKIVQPIAPGVVVVPAYAVPTSASKGDRLRTQVEFLPIAGKPLDLVPTGDVGAHMRDLVERAPHLVDVYTTLMSDTGMSPSARFRPTILVGEPGSGKSWAAREIGRVMRLPTTVYSCGGAADSTFQGTASHWASTGPALPTGFILQCRKANPLIVLDEVDKTATGSQNGRLVDALLTFLDRGNSASYRDPSLEMTVDLSHVSYLMTANSVDGIPAPLRDRCRIIEVPNPGWQHVPTLVRRLVEDIARERGLDPRWYPDFAGDELDVIRKGWSGGSIRKLRRAVEVVLDGRDQARGVS